MVYRLLVIFQESPQRQTQTFAGTLKCDPMKNIQHNECVCVWVCVCVANVYMGTHFMSHVNGDGDMCIRHFRIYEEFVQT